MSRKILVLSTVLLIVGVAVLIYADPLARLSLGVGGAPGRTVGFSVSVTRTFTFNNSTITISPGSGGFAGGFPGGGFVTGRGATNTNGTIETLVAMAILGVGLVLEVVTIFLWQGQPKSAPKPTPTT